MPSDAKFRQAVESLAAADSRYAPAAYGFVREAVTHTARSLASDGAGRRRAHITGRQLLEGFRELALERFGCLAGEVLEDWGVRRTEDVGEIVFKLVGCGLLGATEEDSPADFANGYEFAEAFGAPFLPRRGGGPPPDFPPRRLTRPAPGRGSARAPLRKAALRGYVTSFASPVAEERPGAF